MSTKAKESKISTLLAFESQIRGKSRAGFSIKRGIDDSIS